MTTDEDDQFFRDLERQVLDAFELPGDPETIDRLYSSDFLSINAPGTTSNKQEAVEMVGAGEFPISEEVSNDETRVRRFGDTVVITGRSKWIDPEGVLTTVIRHTQIWAEQDGSWQMVGWQGTPVLD